MIRLSVTARLVLLAIGLTLLSNFALIGFVWHQTHNDAIEALQRDASEQADALETVYTSGGDQALREAIRKVRMRGDASLIIAVFDDNGRRLFGVGPAVARVQPFQATFRIGRIAVQGPFATHEVGYALRPAGDNWILNGRLLTDIQQQQHTIERALLLAVLLSLGIGVLGAVILSRYVSARLDLIAQAAEGVAAGDLTRRADVVAGGTDAFDRAAMRINGMLDKIERLMTELAVVTDSLAHDLRSPLTRLRAKTEAALLTPDPAQQETALTGLLVETDLVLRMLTMVIEISRSEAVSRDRFSDTAPAELITEIADLYEPVVEEAGLAFEIAIDDRPAPMPLHRELLSQAITNLIDNALKHAGSGGVVTLRLVRRANGVAIQVEDRGPGIAPEDREQALRRFGRLDAARTVPGAGLGLSLIESVARLHGGRFELDDNRPGLIARIVLPN